MGHDITRKLKIGSLTIILSAYGTIASSAWAQYPTPYISETSPVSAHLDDSAFTLTVMGTGFTTSARVHWRVGTTETPLATTFIKDTELTARVPASLIRTEDTAQITVRNPDFPPHEGTSNVKYFSVTVPSPLPAFAAINLNGVVGGYSFSSITGDFNGDGKVDLALCSFGTVSILLGKGDGSFTPAPSLHVSADAYSIATGDFNADGKLDIVVPGDSTISIFLGNGDGTFTAAPLVTLGSFLYNVVVGDFNADGKLDLAVSDLVSNNVFTLLGHGDGTFTRIAAVTVAPGGNQTQQLSMGDFDRNGTLDLAVLTLVPQGTDFLGTTTILLGNGDGTFAKKTTFDVGYVFLAQGVSTSMGVGDFNGDGKLDLAISGCGASPSCSSVITTILLGDGDGTFTTKSTVAAGGGSVAIGDINGDGKLDLAYAYQTGISILLGNGDGTFNQLVPSGGAGFTLSVTLSDLNNDGRLDLAVATGTFSNAPGNVITLLQQPPSLTATPAIEDFGDVPLGLFEIREVTLTNTSSASVNLASVKISTPGNGLSDFLSLSLCPSSLAPSGSCKVVVVFIAQPGNRRPTATLNVTYGAFGTPLLVPLRAEITRHDDDNNEERHR
jgi:hypothetical protein